MARIAVCIPTHNDRTDPSPLGYPLASLAQQTTHDFSIYIRDEGQREAMANRHVRLLINLLSLKGINVNYWRTLDRRGIGHARRALAEAIQHETFLLWLDDDVLLEPMAIEKLLAYITRDDRIGFVQGTKHELDPTREYHHDINVLNGRSSTSEPVRLYFGDTALLLMRVDALRYVNWEVVTRYSQEGLTGEDVAMSLMVAQHCEGWGVPEAVGWHLSPAVERWQWEPHSDALQIELLSGLVDPEILRKAIPHLAHLIR